MHDEKTLEAVARLHVENLNQGFLATLGPAFLKEMYRAIDHSVGSVLIVERDENGEVIGFVSGAKGMARIYRRMLRRIHVIPFLLAKQVMNPKKLRRIFEVMRYSSSGPQQEEPSQEQMERALAELPEPELLTIAVAPQARGKGVSERLYRSLEAHFRSRGEPAFRIIVGDALAPAHNFYKKMGAVPVHQTEVHKGEGSVIYVHQVRTPT